METRFKEMDCQTMYKLMDDTVISLVYFGSPESLQKDGNMAHMHKVSIMDWFSYPEQPILYFYNTDPECKRKYKLKEDEPSLVLYTNKANFLEGPDQRIYE